jgi:hypothetical protein
MVVRLSVRGQTSAERWSVPTGRSGAMVVRLPNKMLEREQTEQMVQDAGARVTGANGMRTIEDKRPTRAKNGKRRSALDGVEGNNI